MNHPLRLYPWFPETPKDRMTPGFQSPRHRPVTADDFIIPDRLAHRVRSQELLYALARAGRLRHALAEAPACTHPDYAAIPQVRRVVTRFTYDGRSWDTTDPHLDDQLLLKTASAFIEADTIACDVTFADGTPLNLPLPFALCGLHGALDEDYLFILDRKQPPTELELYAFIERACFSRRTGDGSPRQLLQDFRVVASDVLGAWFRKGQRSRLDTLEKLLTAPMDSLFPDAGTLTVTRQGDDLKLHYTRDYTTVPQPPGYPGY